MTRQSFIEYINLKHQINFLNICSIPNYVAILHQNASRWNFSLVNRDLKVAD